MSAAPAVLVTGVAQGIGRAIAEHLAIQGYRVLGIDIAADASRHLTAFEQVDITDTAAARAALARLTARFAVTRLVNNVGSSFRQNLAQSDGTSQRRLDRLNLGSALLCLQAVLPAMRAAHFGRVVNVTSRAVHGRETRSAYAATKAGLAALTRSWALELAHEGIVVNAVAPGMINTELFRRNNPPDRPDVYRLQRAIPMQRVGEPGEVARAVAFFLDETVTYITGQTLFVCGGLSLGTFGAQSPAMMPDEERSTTP